MPDERRLTSFHIERVYGNGIELHDACQAATDSVAAASHDGDERIAFLAASSWAVLTPTPLAHRGNDPFPHLDAGDISLIMPCDGEPDVVAGLVNRVWCEVGAFNASEMRALLEMNPLTLNEGRFDVVDRSALALERLWLHDHLLLERLSLMTALESCGLRPTHTVLFSKADDTLFGRRVKQTLMLRGYTIVPTHNASDYIARNWATATSVIDDGGTLIQRVLEVRDAAVQTPIAIETTTKGMRLLQNAGLADDVVDLASSVVKLSLSRAIATSFTRQILHLNQHSRVDGTNALLFGFGNLGEHVARQLEAVGVGCTIVEPGDQRRLDAVGAGYEAVPNIAALSPDRVFDWAVGCTGFPSITPALFSHLDDGATLCAIASQDLNSIFASFNLDMEITTYGRKLSAGGRYFRILGDGHALNLFQSEGVPEPDFDRFQAEIVQTLMECTALRELEFAVTAR